METSFTGTLDEKRAKAKEIYSKTSLVVAKAANKHTIVEYFIKTITKIDKLCLKINPLALLKKTLSSDTHDKYGNMYWRPKTDSCKSESLSRFNLKN